MGSPHPHTPAGLSARGRYDHKLDVFSFGLLLWEWFARELVHREIEVIDRSIDRSIGHYTALQPRLLCCVATTGSRARACAVRMLTASACTAVDMVTSGRPPAGSLAGTPTALLFGSVAAVR